MDNDRIYKTPQYTRNAIAKYKARNDCLSISLPKGTADRIRGICGETSVNQWIRSLVLRELDKMAGDDVEH